MKMTRRNGSLTTAQGVEAYRGYLMTLSPFNGTVDISKYDERAGVKTRYHIAYAKSVDDAKRQIDELVE